MKQYNTNFSQHPKIWFKHKIPGRMQATLRCLCIGVLYWSEASVKEEEDRFIIHEYKNQIMDFIRGIDGVTYSMFGSF